MMTDPVAAMTNRIWSLLYAAWAVALAASLGALFIGEVMGQTPCLLCWYQRIFMFPLALILAVAAFRADRQVWRYALPLSLIGAAVAGFHSLLYFGLVPERIEPCGVRLSCASADMTIFGSLPLPLLSLLAFAAISGLLIPLAKKGEP